jgi:hypothetical protein
MKIERGFVNRDKLLNLRSRETASLVFNWEFDREPFPKMRIGGHPNVCVPIVGVLEGEMEEVEGTPMQVIEVLRGWISILENYQRAYPDSRVAAFMVKGDR